MVDVMHWWPDFVLFLINQVQGESVHVLTRWLSEPFPRQSIDRVAPGGFGPEAISRQAQALQGQI